MTIHKEGTATISLIAIFVGVLNIFNFSYKSFTQSDFNTTNVFNINDYYFILFLDNFFIPKYFFFPNNFIKDSIDAI
jgi:archaellum biogenesis protein FlaJ (TadC family)